MHTYDVFHDVTVIVVPVQRLKVVGCQNVYLGLTGYISKENNFFCIARFQQRLRKESR